MSEKKINSLKKKDRASVRLFENPITIREMVRHHVHLKYPDLIEEISLPALAQR